MDCYHDAVLGQPDIHWRERNEELSLSDFSCMLMQAREVLLETGQHQKRKQLHIILGQIRHDIPAVMMLCHFLNAGSAAKDFT